MAPATRSFSASGRSSLRTASSSGVVPPLSSALRSISRCEMSASRHRHHRSFCLSDAVSDASGMPFLRQVLINTSSGVLPAWSAPDRRQLTCTRSQRRQPMNESSSIVWSFEREASESMSALKSRPTTSRLLIAPAANRGRDRILLFPSR